jgi:pimeloyl-ACP methyl ester carboxylesterase
MARANTLQKFSLPLRFGDVRVEIAGMYRDGTGIPLVFLHGFGSTKEDYADVIQQEDLADRPVLAYDAPGCGASRCSDPGAVSIPFLLSVSEEVLRARRIERFHLIGHSMGGLTALLLADQDPTRVASFVDIEGNLAPEDCFLSRQIISHHHADPQTFLAEFTERAWNSRFSSSTLYAAALPHKVKAAMVRPIFTSMVSRRHGCSCTASRTTRCPTCQGWPTTASSLPRFPTAGTSRCTPTPRPCGTASPRS